MPSSVIDQITCLFPLLSRLVVFEEREGERTYLDRYMPAVVTWLGKAMDNMKEREREKVEQ